MKYSCAKRVQMDKVMRWQPVCIELGSGRARRPPPEFLAAYDSAIVASKLA